MTHKKCVVKSDDPIVLEILAGAGLWPRLVRWNVSLPDGSKLRSPFIGFLVPEDEIGKIQEFVSTMLLEMFVLQDDPVIGHAYSPEEALGNKFVVVRWLHPKTEAVAIVDVDETQFVCFFDMSPEERADAPFVEAMCRTLQAAADELNRMQKQIDGTLAGDANHHAGVAQIN